MRPKLRMPLDKSQPPHAAKDHALPETANISNALYVLPVPSDFQVVPD